MPNVCNLIFYGDSIALRRRQQNPDWSFTYPFLVSRRLPAFDSVNLMIRNRGAFNSRDVKNIVAVDSGYLAGPQNDPSVTNLCILQVGVVDCAPRPLTYGLHRFTKRTPILCDYVAPLIQATRPFVQRIYSYNAVAAREFAKNIKAIELLLTTGGFATLWLTIPTPPNHIEHRSPGFQQNARIYSGIIRKSVPNSIDIDAEFASAGSPSRPLLTEDGHHFSNDGHEVCAAAITTRLASLKP